MTLIEDDTTRTPLGRSNHRTREEQYKALADQALARYTRKLASQSKENKTNDDGDGPKAAVKLAGQSTEQPHMNPAMIDMPQRNDVLFGRGKNERDHSGNRNLRRICHQMKAIYDASDRDEKTEISKDIVNEIKSIGGLFLKLNDNRDGWLVASDAHARQKVSQMMRDTQLGNYTKLARC